MGEDKAMVDEGTERAVVFDWIIYRSTVCPITRWR